mmetsp:Transcript_67547/g.156786  ORF Transcript_67547/g.156786 Transcript_67547/m.156786 type:complete len:268 (+) Transcript_67547:745-1548(+)
MSTASRAASLTVAAVLPTRSTASRAASLTAPTAPFSRKSCTVLSHSCFNPWNRAPLLCAVSTSPELPTACSGAAVAVGASESASFVQPRSISGAAIDLAPSTAVLAVLPTMPTASSATPFIAQTAPFSRKSWTVGSASDRALPTAVLAVLPTISTASKAASFIAPTAPFSRNSCTVLLSSCFSPSSTDIPAVPMLFCPAVPEILICSTCAGSKIGTSKGCSKLGATTRARGGSDTPSTSTTAASRIFPSAKHKRAVVPRLGTAGPIK